MPRIAMNSKLLISYNGVEATEIIANDCDGFTWKDNAGGESDTVTLNLSNLNLKWMNGYLPIAGDTFKCWIQLTDWAVDSGQAAIYCGNFQVDSLKYSGWPERLQLSGISVPVNANFNVKQKTKTWKKTTCRTILADIAKEAGIALFFDAVDQKIETITQNGKTDLEFANQLAKDYGFALKAYDNKIVVYDQAAYEKKPPAYVIDRSELGESGSYSITSAITKIYDSVKIQYTPKTKGAKTLTYEYVVPGSLGKRQLFVSKKADSLKDAEMKAKAALRENMRTARTITIKKIGSPKFVAAQTFMLTGFAKLDGLYFIDNVVHTKTGGKYTVSITAHSAVTAF